MRRASLLLVNPRVAPLVPYRNVVTLGLGYLAAVEKDRRHVRVIHQEWEMVSDEDVLFAARDFDVIGITAMSFQLGSALRLASRIKSLMPEKIVIMGGVASSACYSQCLDSGSVDAVAVGEGEYAISMIMERVDSGFDLEGIPGTVTPGDNEVIPGTSSNLMAMKDIPFPTRTLMPSKGIIPKDPVFNGRPSAVIMLSRGCPFSCVFCAVPNIWGRKIRRRSPRQSMEEIGAVIKELGIIDLALEDDCFTADKQWTLEFCDLMSRMHNVQYRINTHADMVDEEIIQALKKSGCRKVTYGVESVNLDIRSLACKPLNLSRLEELLAVHRQMNLPAATLFMIGLPGETEETVQANIDWLQRVRPNGGWDFQVAQPHPGSRFGREADAYGRLLTDNPDDFFSDHLTYVPESFSPERFHELCGKVCGRVIRMAVSNPGCEIQDTDMPYTLPASQALMEDSGDSRILAQIAPEWWTAQTWDSFGGLWQGSERCRTGLSFVRCNGAGSIDYMVRMPDTGDCWTMLAARMASHHYVWPTPPAGASMVECIINGSIVGRRLIHSIHTVGTETTFMIPPGRWKRGENHLRFKVTPGPYANGLAIFSFPIHPFFSEMAMPIRVVRIDE